MNFKIIGTVAAAVVAIVGAYFFGYSVAETEGELALESLKKANAEAVITAQNEVKKDYEARMQNLMADLERVRSDNAQRLRQLEAFRNANRDLEACRRDRSDLAGLAIRGEELLGQADSYLRAFTK